MAMLSIDVREKDGIAVVDVSGRLVLGPEGQDLLQRVKQLIAERRLKILVNFAGLTFIDSCGVGELVASLSSVKKNGGVMKLAGPTALVRDVLRVVRVPTIIDVYDSESEALTSFAEGK
jgi:anti-sigma B factor antagonist